MKDEDRKPALVGPDNKPIHDTQEQHFKVGAQLAMQRQRVEEAKFAILVELCQAVEELSDTVWAVAGQLLPPGKGRKARSEFETLQLLRAQKHDREDAATIEKIRGGSNGQ